jgi:hypothetical protein
VGGDKRVVAFSPMRMLPGSWDLPETPRALAFGPDAAMLIGLSGTVLRYRYGENPVELFRLPGEKARITSIAVDRDAIYTADAGERLVYRHGHDGTLLGRIGEEDLEGNVDCFNVPSPYFDVLMAPDGLLRIVDPGRHLVTAFTTDGDRELAWGTRSFELPGFSGCCNPSHIAMLPDGRFVTSEKGLPRIKVYDADGRFVNAVVGPDGLATEYDPCDVAVDGKGHIYALDPGARVVRVFAEVPSEE